jgi:hypothetical protein
MRSIIKVSVLILLVFITSVIFTKKVSAQQSNVSFQVFYDQLSPYGEWVNYPQLGFVWIPDAGPDFVPYSTQGHWILTDAGWTWMSDYSWGWAPFHYGRWDYDQYYGWLWVPGNEWGPAWVSWRMAEGYYGWAPLEPGISLSATFGRAYDIHDDHWIFVRDRDIDRSDINHYYVSRTDQDRIVRHSSVINNTYVDSRRHTTYVIGPSRADIQKVTGRKLNPVAVQEYNKPGQALNNGHFQIYRPSIVKTSNKEKQPAPSRVTNLKDVSQASERKVGNQAGTTNSTQNTKDVKHTNTVDPKKNLNNTKTIQSQSSNPPKNVNTVKQPVNVNLNNTKAIQSQNSNPPKNVNTIKQPVTVKSQNKNLSQNIKKDPQSNNAKPVINGQSQNIKREPQPDNIKMQNSNLSQNVKKDLQPNKVNIQNSNQAGKSGNTKQSIGTKSQKNNNEGQQDKTIPQKDIKQND